MVCWFVVTFMEDFQNHSFQTSLPQEDKIDRARWPEYELLKEINKALYSGGRWGGDSVTGPQIQIRLVCKRPQVLVFCGG